MPTTFSPRIVAVLPFGIAFFMLLISPEIVETVKRAVIARLERANSQLGIKEAALPPYLVPDSVGAYVEFAADAAQAASILLVTTYSVVIAVLNGLPVIASIVWMVAIPAGLLLQLRVLQLDPIIYVRRKLWNRYTPITIVGMALNMVGGILALLLVRN